MYFSYLEMWIINGVKNVSKATLTSTSNSMQMHKPEFISTVKPWTKLDRQGERAQVVWGLMGVKTTASVYTLQLPQTCIHFYARRWEIPASGKCVSVYFNSHTWRFGKCLKKKRQGFNSAWGFYIDSSFHKLRLHVTGGKVNGQA